MRARSSASPSAEALPRAPPHDGEDRCDVDDAAERRAHAQDPPDMLAGPRRLDAHHLRRADAEERVDLVDQERGAELAAAHEEPAARPRDARVPEQGREI